MVKGYDVGQSGVRTLEEYRLLVTKDLGEKVNSCDSEAASREEEKRKKAVEELVAMIGESGLKLIVHAAYGHTVKEIVRRRMRMMF